MSWMLQQKKQKRAAQAKQPASGQVQPPRPSVEVPDGADKDFNVWLRSAKMEWDKLKAIPDHDLRNKQKPAVIDKFRDVLAAYMEAEATHENGILAMCIIWAADSEDWETLIEYTDYAVKTKQVTMLLKRPLWTFAADSMHQSEADSVKAHLPALLKRVEGDEPLWPLKNDPQLAKIYRRLGLDAEAAGEIENAVGYLQHAFDLDHPNVGVKTRLEKLQKQLKETGSSPQVSGDGSATAEESAKLAETASG